VLGLISTVSGDGNNGNELSVNTRCQHMRIDLMCCKIDGESVKTSELELQMVGSICAVRVRLNSET
jgi:hypothetical protein